MTCKQALRQFPKLPGESNNKWFKRLSEITGLHKNSLNRYFYTKRKFFYLAILLLSLLLGAGDIMASILLCLPLFGLYESGILIIRLFTRKSAEEDLPADTEEDL